jgi:hypothetical protein
MAKGKPSLERIRKAIDRLDALVASLLALRDIPDSLHVTAMRSDLPGIATELRRALDGELPERPLR